MLDQIEAFITLQQVVNGGLAKWGNTIAIEFLSDKITYAQLEERSNILAQKITLLAPHAPIVGISASREVSTIIGILAILKAGKAYLPLDIHHPNDRLQGIINDASLQFVVCSEQQVSAFEKLSLQCIHEASPFDFLPALHPSLGNLVYVLYTSGSTGKPKGVCMVAEALDNLLQWQTHQSNADTKTHTLQFAPLGFDVSFQEIFATFTTGGTLVLVNDATIVDPNSLLDYIIDRKIGRLFLPFVALQFITEAAVALNRYPTSLKEVITAGEQLKITPQVIKFFQKLGQATLYNQYGPTECHVVTQLKLDGDPATWPELPSIGYCLPNTQAYILNNSLQPVRQGEEGELALGGACLAQGYLNNADLTSLKFKDIFLPNIGKKRIYLTGDIAKYLPNGELQFLGRRDDQVKISGFRVEPGEIEVVLSKQKGVLHAVVLAIGMETKKLVAYIVGDITNIQELKKNLSKQLPDYMMPSVFMHLADLPRTPNGKVDKLRLPRPEFRRPEMQVPYVAPTTPLQQQIADAMASLLQWDRVGIKDHFFDSGGNSLLAVKLVTLLATQHKIQFPVTKLYQYPTIEGLTAHLDGTPTSFKVAPEVEKVKPKARQHHDVAIIGMSGRFPGAITVDALWDLLKDNKESITFFSENELDKSIDKDTLSNSAYVRARGVLQSAMEFDAQFFGINSQLASVMDPQHRVFLEMAYEVLEQSGYHSTGYSVGVFAGCSHNTYLLNNVLHHKKLMDQVGSFQVMTANDKDYIATRTAFALNLNGPAINVQSACSTSLLAIAQAAKHIRSGQCDMAIAGGISITAPINSGHIYEEGAMFSADGHTRPFDAQAQGTVFSDGGGVLLLKDLQLAEQDGDHIYGIIKGIGISNDGGNKASFSAPSAVGQASAIAQAISDAQIAASEISYVETHGTATPLGDPIEIEGLQMALGEDVPKAHCGIGSIKSNIGHLTAGAGVAGVIKVLLSMQHELLPATLFYKAPNPNINFTQSPFYVVHNNTPWPAQAPRFAGVSSFGVGGTNVHLVLRDYHNKPVKSDTGRGFEVLCWSAQSNASAQQNGQRLQEYVHNHSALHMADVAHHLHQYRRRYSHRQFAVVSHHTPAAEAIAHQLTLSQQQHCIKGIPSGLVFVFPGQGAQYLHMGMDLYIHEPVFRTALDECADILESEMGEDILAILFVADKSKQAEEQLKNTKYSQPAIFAFEYALAKLWMHWGIQPTMFVGHSIGEFVAAHLAGIFSLQDVLKLVAHRALLMSSMPGGSMLSIRANVDTVKALLPSNLSIAAINSPNLCVVAGDFESIDAFSIQLNAQNIVNKPLATSHAFHSGMMDGVIEPFRAVVNTVNLNPPTIPIISTVTGVLLTNELATSSIYWAQHLRATVEFNKALAGAIKDNVLLEIGPSNVTTTLARQQPEGAMAIASLDRKPDDVSEYQPILRAVGHLWNYGIELNWAHFYADQVRVPIHNLPTYAFDRKQCWVAAPEAGSITVATPAAPSTIIEQPSMPIQRTLSKSEIVEESIKQLIEDASGISMKDAPTSASFMELGLDSLLLTQLAIACKKHFQLPITFRQINEHYSSIALLQKYVEAHIADVLVSSLGAALQNSHVAQYDVDANNAPLAKPTQQKEHSIVNANLKPVGLSEDELKELKKPFGATARIEKQSSTLSAQQKKFLQSFIARYNQKTNESKQYTQKHRAYMSDPRVVTGFKPELKEMIYPIVVRKSKGCKLWDIDGNEYIDVLNGFGSSMLGYQPDMVVEAVKQQIDKGYELGPQHELAGDVCKLICEFTQFDRSALCNTGSEAVLGAMRIARTVTGRSLIVAFNGSYHGINDEVIIRGTKQLKSFPAAAGIMPEAVQNMLILDYGTDESLRIIKERAHELAAVLVEPVQSRRPEFRPKHFIQEVRKITEASETLLIFDEVITGFRMHPAGMQALYEVSADLGTYGKVVAAGMPIGVIAGKKKFMDALDGGYWEYGNDSVPESGVTYFAGTFVRHPLALAAAKVSLTYLKSKGEALQQGINQLTTTLSNQLNSLFEAYQLPMYIASFGSLWKVKWKEEVLLGELLFLLLREKGIHIWDGFPCFLTEAHTLAEVEVIVAKFEEAITEMIHADIFKQPDFVTSGNNVVWSIMNPPMLGAKIGRDASGNPGWYIPNPENTQQYIQIA